MDKINVEFIDIHNEMRERFQFRFTFPPVIVLPPATADPGRIL